MKASRIVRRQNGLVGVPKSKLQIEEEHRQNGWIGAALGGIVGFAAGPLSAAIGGLIGHQVGKVLPVSKS